jgi:signal peptidase I
MTEATDSPDINRPPLSAPILDAALEAWNQAREQHFIPITGHSMQPLLRAGDRVLVAHGSAGVRRGDVIVFQRQGGLVAHRVLRVESRPSGRVFLTKGDNSRRFDPLLSANEVVGRALAVERGGRQISLDTAAWRAAGWLIALGTLGGTKLYAWGRAVKRRLWGPQPSRLAALLHRGAQVLSASVLRVFQMLLAPAAFSTRPEDEMLICCARTRVDSASAERIKILLQKDIDWTYLVRSARRHGVMPLLYQSLRTTCPETVPQAIMDQLQGHFHTNALRNHFLTQELLRLLNLFKAHGIPALTLKGPVLAASVYGNLALRQFCDLDILVQEQDFSSARALLLSQGYHSPGKLTRAQETASLQVRHHAKFVRDDGRVLVELHWRIVERRFSFALDRLWERLEPVSLAGATVSNLPPEDLLLYLCAHGSKPAHHWGRLGWVCDVSELIRTHPGLDWERVITQAGRLGYERRLLLGLCLSRDLSNITLPEQVRKKVRADPVVELLAAQAVAWLFCETDDGPGVLTRTLFDLKAIERRPDRARFCLHLALALTVVKWALRPPIGPLPRLYRPLDRVPTRNVWLWPLPLFALGSFLYHLLLPLRRVAKYSLNRLNKPWFCRGVG